ncbi:hypothetical protein RDI58_013173 [Solanum bulbocastanum]|uniref:Uncharacterized protein n=1 Tax=Solanum bulbocastanum TaxID=147425 RepID=A0AAN8TKF6_SOLBU
MSFILEKSSSFDGLTEAVPGIRINIREIMMISEKARQHNCSMPFPIRYFGSDEAISVGTEIALDKKRDAKAPSVGDARCTITPQTPSTATSKRSVYQELVETTNRNNWKLIQLAVALPKMIDNTTTNAMRGLVAKVDSLNLRVGLIEGTVTNMQAEVEKWKGKAHMGDGAHTIDELTARMNGNAVEVRVIVEIRRLMWSCRGLCLSPTFWMME